MHNLTISLVLLLATAAAAHAYDTPSGTQFQHFLSDPAIRTRVTELESYLQQHGVSGVVPTEHLLRQGTAWRKTKKAPFFMPPKNLWPNIIPTLRVIRDLVIPAIGEVEVVSAYRTPDYNSVAGGIPESKHLLFAAVDLIPKRQITRTTEHTILKNLWVEHGEAHALGLGLYSRLRFHIDTAGYRTW